MRPIVKPVLLAAGALLLAGCGSKPAAYDRVMLTALAEPAVFEIARVAEYSVRDVTVRRNFANLAIAGPREDCWAAISSAPAEYLQVTRGWRESTVVRSVIPRGSAVAVNRQGVFLTNAHVVESLDRDALRAEFPGLERILETLASSLRAGTDHPGCATDLPPDAEFRRKFAQRIAWWLLEESLDWARNGGVWVVARPREIRIPLFTPIKLDSILGLHLTHTRLADLLTPPDTARIDLGLTLGSEMPDTIATEADIVEVGQTYPGEDIAVLKTRTALDLVCLRLGDAGAAYLPDGSPIIAFGFPSAADLPGLAKDKAHPQVISHDGAMLRRIRTSKNWEALYITAAVSNGDSGGPVLDARGRVVGLTVFGSTSTSGNNLAVSIGVAKKYLAKAKIAPDAGKTTEHWEQGLAYYFDRDYGRALKEFELVNGKNQILMGRGNQYVEQAIANCRDILKRK